MKGIDSVLPVSQRNVIRAQELQFGFNVGFHFDALLLTNTGV